MFCAPSFAQYGSAPLPTNWDKKLAGSKVVKLGNHSPQSHKSKLLVDVTRLTTDVGESLWSKVNSSSSDDYIYITHTQKQRYWQIVTYNMVMKNVGHKPT